MPTLALIRGLPGSGKSTLAKKLVGFEHYEADMFFMKDGQYCYDKGKLAAAHTWCQQMTKEALNLGKHVVVSNTFTRISELEPYFQIAKELGASVVVVEVNGNWPNVHGVPQEVIERMRARWEPYPKQATK
jgi:predicted kinase